MRSSESFIGNRMRELRKTKRMTLVALGKATGLSVGFLSQVERDLSSPSIKALHDIARVLGVNISWFFEENDPATTEERRSYILCDRRSAGACISERAWSTNCCPRTFPGGRSLC